MKKSVRKEIEEAARILREAGATEVYLFGSAASETDAPDSDIDLAVKGLPPEAYFAAVGKVAMAVPRRFDVIDMDEPNLFTDYLTRKGKLVRVA